MVLSRGGHLGIFWVGMCRPGLQNGTPFWKKFPLKLIPPGGVGHGPKRFMGKKMKTAHLHLTFALFTSQCDMGITGLLPLLKDITWDVHVRSFSGKVAAIDAYCWLHKAAIFCAEEIILGIETTRYVSTLRSYTCLKCMILNVSFSLVVLFTSDFIFSGTLTCA